MLESKLIIKIKDYAKSKSFYIIKYHGGSFTEVGVPDLIACYKGVFIGLEAKVGSGVVSEAQKFDLHKIRQRGGFSAVIRETDYKEIIDKIVLYISEGRLHDLQQIIPIPERCSI